MQEHKYKHRHSHKKDGIDTFREQSLKAIQRKKLYAKSCKNHAGEHLKILI